MAKNKYDVEIRGDNTGLVNAVNSSVDELNKLDSVAGGMFSNFTGPLNNLKGGLGVIQSMSPALRALGVAGLAAGAGLAAINKAQEVVGTLTQISTNTGVSIEMLQQLQKEFKITGMTVEKFGDINKDTMDKLGDSFRNGKGGIADDLKEWGIGLEELTKYAGDAEGGIKAVIDVFYKMKDAGKSQAEIVNAMESMASDASGLITTLDQYSSSQEALNAIQSRNADITEETAEKYKKFDDNMKRLSVNVDNLTVNAMSPLVEEINNLWEWFDKDWENTGFFKGLKKLNKAGVSPSGMSSGQVSNLGKTEDDIWQEQLKVAKEKAEKNFIQQQKNQELYKKQKEAEARANKVISDREAKDKEIEADKAAKSSKAAADKLQSERERAAREAKASYDKMMAERKQSVSELAAIDISLISSQGRSYASQSVQLQSNLTKLKDLRDKDIIDQEQYNQRRQALLKTASTDFYDSIKDNPENVGMIRQSIEQIYEAQKQKAEIEKQQGLIDQQTYNDQLVNLEAEKLAKMDELKKVNGDSSNLRNLSAIGFATDDEEMALQQEKLQIQFDKMHEQNQALYDSELISHEAFLQQKQRLEQAYSVKSKNISLMETKTRLGMYNDFAQGMAGVSAGMLGENSKAAMAMFAVAKGTAIAQGMLNAYESSTVAMAKYPGPLGYAMAASSYAQVLGQVMSMKSVTPQGMAHDGIDNVPTEGTWLLDGGERVVDQRTNEDLKEFLDGSSGNEQSIDARLIVQGNVYDERWFLAQAKKHEQSITSIVQSGQRRRQ
ncbi:SHOCT domain-containing protein [Kluyvera intermedia]|uniref:SHOCT domain-containing protein n=1 Tax=Kluyvera intermedia TaxID=61648 RepID=UPI0034A28A66